MPKLARKRARTLAASASTFGLWTGIATALLGAAALANALAARRAERRHPPQGKFLDVNGVHLHYLERGAGSPVVLLHGNGTTAEDFALSGTLDRIAAHHRVIAFDRPGFGYSERPRRTIWTPQAQGALFREALRRLSVDLPILVGHSWGTLVALNMALDRPGEIDGLVLVSGYYIPVPSVAIPAMAAAAMPILGDLLCHTIAPPLHRLMAPWAYKKLFAPGPVVGRFKTGFPLGMTVRPSQLHASAADIALMNAAAARTALRHGELVLPMVIIAGEGDEIVNTDTQSRRLAADVPGSELRVIPGAGHMIPHTAPEAIAAAVDSIFQFLAERGAP